MPVCRDSSSVEEKTPQQRQQVLSPMFKSVSSSQLHIQGVSYHSDEEQVIETAYPSASRHRES